MQVPISRCPQRRSRPSSPARNPPPRIPAVAPREAQVSKPHRARTALSTGHSWRRTAARLPLRKPTLQSRGRAARVGRWEASSGRTAPSVASPWRRTAAQLHCDPPVFDLRGRAAQRGRWEASSSRTALSLASPWRKTAAQEPLRNPRFRPPGARRTRWEVGSPIKPDRAVRGSPAARPQHNCHREPYAVELRERAARRGRWKAEPRRPWISLAQDRGTTASANPTLSNSAVAPREVGVANPHRARTAPSLGQAWRKSAARPPVRHPRPCGPRPRRQAASQDAPPDPCPRTSRPPPTPTRTADAAGRSMSPRFTEGSSRRQEPRRPDEPHGKVNQPSVPCPPPAAPGGTKTSRSVTMASSRTSVASTGRTSASWAA